MADPIQNPPSLAEAAARITELEARDAAIRALHARDDSHSIPCCTECGDSFPCPTIRILDGEPA